MVNAPPPNYGETGFTRTIYVLPPAPYLVGDKRLFGVVTPFVVRSLTALRADNGTVFVSYAATDGTVKMLTFSTPNGTFYVEEPLYQPNRVPFGFRQVVYAYADRAYVVVLGFEYNKYCIDINCYIYSIMWRPFRYAAGSGLYACRFRGDVPSSLECISRDGRVTFISWSIDSNGVVSVYRDGVLQRRTRLGQLSAALAWTPDGRMYAALPAGIVSDTARVSAPLAYRWSFPATYNYTLMLSIAFDRELNRSYQFGRTVYKVYNVTYRGVMNLTYNGNPVALDAFYGWYYMVTSYALPPPPPPPDEPVIYTGGGSFCTPTRIKIGEEQEHRELNKGSNDYSVQVVVYAIIRVTGCGYDYTYGEVISVTTLTANGDIYQVTDDNGKVCGYDRAEKDDDGVVRCRHPGDEQSR